MKFDLFNAIYRMEKEIGRDSEIIVSHNNHTGFSGAVFIRLRAFRGSWYNREIKLTDDFISDSAISCVDELFDRELAIFKKQLEAADNA